MTLALFEETQNTLSTLYSFSDKSVSIAVKVLFDQSFRALLYAYIATGNTLTWS